MDEIARVAPQLFGGVRYERLASDGLQWLCPAPDHAGTATMHTDGFMRGKGRLVAIDFLPHPEQSSESFPYLLVTGRVLDHYNVGTMTRRTPQRDLVSEDVLEIHPDDAEVEKLADNEVVRLESHWGSIEVKVRLSGRIAPRTLFLAFHFPETHTNRVIGPHVDPESKCPQYKATAVRLRPIRPANA
jgi:formate dehydrogenase major subunit